MKTIVPFATLALLTACGQRPEKKAPPPATAPAPTPASAPTSTPAVASASAPATVAASAPAEQPLFDFRTRAVATSPTAPPSERPSASEEEAVHAALRKILGEGKALQRSEALCGREEGSEETYPIIRDSREGAFTAPGAKETLYLVEVYRCDPEESDEAESHHAVLLSGGAPVGVFSGQVVSDGEPGGFYGDALLATFDADQNGTVEILTSTGGMEQGVQFELARVYHFVGNKLTTVKEFQETFTDACDSGLDDHAIEASIVYYTPGPKPVYTAKIFDAPCKDKLTLSDFRPRP